MNNDGKTSEKKNNILPLHQVQLLPFPQLKCWLLVYSTPVLNPALWNELHELQPKTSKNVGVKNILISKYYFTLGQILVKINMFADLQPNDNYYSDNNPIIHQEFSSSF